MPYAHTFVALPEPPPLPDSNLTNPLQFENARLRAELERLKQHLNAINAGDGHAEPDREETVPGAREEVLGAVEMKSIFLANMSHEIRTPLTGILGCASILTRTLEGKPRSYAERIERSAKRLTETLNAVLTLAHLESGRVAMHLESLEIAAETAEIVRIYKPEATRKNLSLSLETAPGAFGAHAMLDRGALKGILQKLIGNAIKFTERGGVTVRISVEDAVSSVPNANGRTASERRVVIRVADTGIGISEAFIARIFHPFTQESTGLERTHEGSGLGLCIAHQFAEHMRGSLRVESTKGRGSVFTVSFPCSS
ncbi:MAG TPA: HAMP domain-containing sensor histidine kinase [Rhodothermales bacterium]|nr:HAMP domain-containing sensor histidine kinase [Rhodothermales bacterium]